MEDAKSIALSTASFASGPLGRTRHRFIIPLYSPMIDADLHAVTGYLCLRKVCAYIAQIEWLAERSSCSAQLCLMSYLVSYPYCADIYPSNYSSHLIQIDCVQVLGRRFLFFAI